MQSDPWKSLSLSLSGCHAYNLEKGPLESFHFLSLLDHFNFMKFWSLEGLLSFLGLVSLPSPSGGVFHYGGNNYPTGILQEQPPQRPLLLQSLEAIAYSSCFLLLPEAVG